MADPASILDDHNQLAKDLVDKATEAITSAAAALSESGIYTYSPYQFTDIDTNFLGGPDTSIHTPVRPKEPNLDKLPKVQTVPTDVPTFNTTLTLTAPSQPTVTVPTAPAPSLPATLQAPTSQALLFLPSAPSLVPLGDTQLPYPTISVPTAPVWSNPTFTGVAPAPLQQISMSDYLQKLTDTYASYSTIIPALVQSNWRAWYQLLLSDHPMIGTLTGILNTYFAAGGAGIPLTIEDGIVTRAQDRIAGEARRARMKVWEEMDKRGLWMPSGALTSGLKEAAQKESEDTSKVVTDVAIKQLDLEHDHMKYMMKLGQELEANLLDASMQLAKVNTELNAQAIDITKTVLTGMIEINKAMVAIYLAQWEGYKAAVAFYQTQIQAIESQVRLYEAQIRAELAKTEINKSKVDVLNALANANRALVEMYKTQIEGETAKLEVDRVKAQIFEAQTRAYVGQIEAYRAQWDGYKASVEGQVAVANVYTAQVQGYKAQVEAFTARAQAYESQVRAVGVRAQAVATSNKAQLDAWTAQADGQLKAFGYEMDAYRIEWSAAVERMKIQSTYWQLSVEEIRAHNSTHLQQQLEAGREHLAQWTAQLEGALRAAQGLTSVAQVATGLASSAMAGVTSFAGLTEQVIAS
jgi:hypothetical protein